MNRTDPKSMSPGSPAPFGALREQLVEAAVAFSGDAVADILTGLVDDVDRALREELEIFPVCHHSPASATAMVRRLREKRPEVIYLELCEDLQPLLAELRNCRLPVALQSFATELDGFPAAWAPLSVIAPITEASAEYQAIAYALDTPGVELVLVDRSTDHVFQWTLDDQATAEPEGGAEAGDQARGGSGSGPDSPSGSGPGSTSEQPAAEDAALHGDAVGIEIGDLRPRFAELERFLLHHGKVRHWSEWWDQYVEQPLVGADYDTYRQVMVMIGSLFRRLRPERDSRGDRDEDRERYMWTRMREHLTASGTDPSRCLYVCGSFHAASRVEQFGLAAGGDPDVEPYAISPRTATRWRYGLIPSSHSAIEAQFGLAPGSVSIAAATWSKALRHGGVTPFRLSGPGTGGKRPGTGGGKEITRPKKEPSATGRAGTGSAVAVGSAAPPPPLPPAPPPATATVPEPVTDRLSGFLSTPPAPDGLDEAELLGWCVDIVRLARRNGYLASTADAIAVYETSILLAGMRGRRRPTPYDFEDAAVTCIEKDTVPGRRDVRRLCEILLGGDRIGQVGYESLPPLARDVLDRLEPLGLDLSKRTIQRALIDLDADPRLRPCSDLLWVLRRLLPDDAVRPIMGSRRLGERSIQESWDLAIGRNQRSLVELGYEGVTIEQVLEQRLRRAVYDPQATAATALAAVEDALLYLGGHRVSDDLGRRAVELLAAERTVDDAPEVLRRIRRLLTHYRTAEPELPEWCRRFVAAGYAHYCTLLPTAFLDEDTGVRQVAAMLGFLFSMESLALSLGCDHTQLELAVRQSHPEAPAKVALLWAARSQLGSLPPAELRARYDELLGNPLVVPAIPLYLSGFVQALEPVPTLAPVVVEVMSKAFARLPDSVLLPWLPKLITSLRDEARELVPVLVREAGRTFPATLPALDAWTPPWSAGAAGMVGAAGPGAAGPGATPVAGPSVVAVAAARLMTGHPASCDAVARLLGHEAGWRQVQESAGGSDGTGTGGAGDPTAREAGRLLARHATTAEAVADLLAPTR